MHTSTQTSKSDVIFDTKNEFSSPEKDSVDIIRSILASESNDLAFDNCGGPGVSSEGATASASNPYLSKKAEVKVLIWSSYSIHRIRELFLCILHKKFDSWNSFASSNYLIKRLIFILTL